MPANRAAVAFVAFLLAASISPTPAAAQTGVGSVSVSVFAGGLDNPRGLKFGPQGFLYVAEGGVGGDQSTVGQCAQVLPPVGPYTGSNTGARISRLDRAGHRTTVAAGLPSSQTSPLLGGLVSGVGDIAFVGDRLYAVLAGAGCSHGITGTPNGVLQVSRKGGVQLLADLSGFQQANPVAQPEPDDFEPDGTWYSMVSFGGALYAVEPNHGELDRISVTGHVSRVIDISASQGHVVPTAMTFHAGSFYVGTLMPFPAAPVAKVYRITPGGDISVVAEGLTTVVGVAFRNHELYVLEASAPVTSPGPPLIPGTGRVVRVTGSGALEPVVTGLTFPSAMTFSPRGDLYISNFGFGFPPGAGQVVKARIPHGDEDD